MNVLEQRNNKFINYFRFEYLFMRIYRLSRLVANSDLIANFDAFSDIKINRFLSYINEYNINMNQLTACISLESIKH